MTSHVMIPAIHHAIKPSIRVLSANNTNGCSFMLCLMLCSIFCCDFSLIFLSAIRAAIKHILIKQVLYFLNAQVCGVNIHWSITKLAMIVYHLIAWKLYVFDCCAVWQL